MEEKQKVKRIRTFSPAQIKEREFKKLDLGDRWEGLLGTPSPNFNSLIYGRANGGKSPFCVQLAGVLSSFGKVLYVSSEELISLTLKERLILNNVESDRIRFAPVRKVEQIEQLVRRTHPRFIIIDSVQICNMSFKDFTHLKNDAFKNRKGWHLVSQTTNSGKPLLPQKWFHEVDAKIQIIHGVAHCVSRYKSKGRMNVFEKTSNADLFTQENSFQTIN